MRFPLGFSILLVILLGFVCISPIRAHYNYDYDEKNSPSGEKSGQGSDSSAPLSAAPAAAAPPSPSNLSSESPSVASDIQVSTGAISNSGDNSRDQSSISDPSPAEISPLMNQAEDVETFAQSENEPSEQPRNTKRQEVKQFFGQPKQTNSAGSDQAQGEGQQNEQEQEQRKNQDQLSPPVNQPTKSEQLSPASDSQQQHQQQQQQQQQPSASQGRGIGDMVSGIFNQNSGTQQQEQQQQQQQQVQLPINLPSQMQQYSSVPSPGDVPREHLPTIIEKDQPVSVPQNLQQQQQPQEQKQQQPQQQQQQKQQQEQQQTGSRTALVLPSMVAQGNSSLGPSTSRTFGEGWTDCQGSSSNKYGTCKNDVNCKKDKGYADGSCMSGLGVCCVMALTCGDKSSENNTFFANPDFPEPSWEARLCEVEIKKKHSKISQIMIEFEEFELAPPNYEGECITDVFQIKLGSGRVSPYSLLRICGQNTGQHLYLDVSWLEKEDEKLILSVATSGGGFPRRWSVRIVHLDEKNYLLAPPGCLQYYTDTIGHFRSFNLGHNLRNLYYAICFRIDHGYSGIRFTSNFFGMNGHHCRKRPLALGGGGIGRHHNFTREAHLHHLVIPPPGYAPPPPRPRHELGGYQHQSAYPLPQPPHPVGYPQQYPQSGPAGKYYPSAAPMPQYYPGDQKLRVKREDGVELNERFTRTHDHEHHHAHHLHEHEHHHDGKHFKHDDKEPLRHDYVEHYGPSYPPANYGSYGPHAPGYGPPQPQRPPNYGGHGNAYGPHNPSYGAYDRGYYDDGKKDGDKWGWKSGDKKDDKWDSKSDKKDDKWFWKSDKKDDKDDKKDDKWSWKGDKKDDKFGWKGGDKKDDKYGYNHEVGPYGNNYHHPPHHSNYGPGYGPGYGDYGGGYHHKEIDKFGKKYEHLEYKHDKKDKDGKSDDKGWWWWKKEGDKKKDKDKEKYFQHHEALFPMMRIPDMSYCEPRFCGANDVILFPPSGDSISEMCGNRFNRGRGPKIVSGSPLVVYVSNRGHNRGAGFDLNYEQVFYVPKPY